MEEKNIIGIILSAFIFTTTLVALYSFSTLNITLNSFLTINLLKSISPIFSLHGIVFFIVSALPISIILLIGEKFEYNKALIFCESSYILAVLIGVLMFNLFEWIVPFIFLAIGIIWGINWLKLKESELKSKLKFSASQGAAQKILLVSIIGFILILSITSFSQAEKLENNFIPEILELSIGDMDNFEESITDLVVEISIESQKGIINSLTNLESYQNLSEKNDEDVLVFVLQTETLKNQINNPDYQKTIKSTMNENKGEINFASEIIQQLPLLKFSKYSWIFYILISLITINLFSNIFMKNLIAIYYTILKIIFKKILPENNNFKELIQEEPQQNQNFKY
jgi:hypothetical protein